jgi:formylglycine-generating enzyme required for sulfatase activity
VDKEHIMGEKKISRLAVGVTLLGLILHSLACKKREASQPTPGTEPAKPLGHPKESILDLGNNVTMKLVLISSGKFMMGSPNEDKDREESEGPQHEVTISKPFYLGVFEVRFSHLCCCG